MVRRVLGAWVAATLAAGVLALTAAPAPVASLDVGAGADAVGQDLGVPTDVAEAEVPPSTVPSTLPPGTSPTTRPPTAPDQNPTEGDIPPDLRPLDPETGAPIGPPPPSGTLVGRVVGRDGRPAAGVCITLDFPIRTGLVTDGDGRWSTTGPDGGGSQVLGVHLRDCDGVAPHWLPLDEFVVHLLVTGRTTTVQHTLDRAGRLEVSVVDQWGRPQAGQCVVTAGVDGPTTATTDGQGRATFPVVPLGEGRSAGVGPTCASAPIPFEQPTTTVPEGGTATLRLVIPRPDNDDRARAWNVVGSGELASGGILATTEAGESMPSCFGGGSPAATVWYRRPPTATAAPAAHLRNAGAGGPGTAIAVHREVAGQLVEAACVVPRPDFPRPEAAVPVAAGEVVWFQLVTPLAGIQHATASWSDG